MPKHPAYGDVPDYYTEEAGSAFHPTPLPTEEEMEEILDTRPGDGVYQAIKPIVERIKKESASFREQLLEIILRDMYLDLALSGALDDAGITAEYLAQEMDVDKPTFRGDVLMADFARISKFKTSLELGKLLKLSDEEMELVMREETARLWHDPRSGQVKQPSPTLTLPDEVLGILRGLSKLSKGSKDGPSGKTR